VLLCTCIAYFAVIFLCRGLRSWSVPAPRYSSVHRRNLANNICECDGGTKSTIGVRDFNLGRNKRGKRLKIGLNQSFIHIHAPYSPILIHILLFCRLQSSSKKILFLCKKMLGEDLPSCPPPNSPQFTSMPGPTDTCAFNMFIF